MAQNALILYVTLLKWLCGAAGVAILIYLSSQHRNLREFRLLVAGWVCKSMALLSVWVLPLLGDLVRPPLTEGWSGRRPVDVALSILGLAVPLLELIAIAMIAAGSVSLVARVTRKQPSAGNL